MSAEAETEAVAAEPVPEPEAKVDVEPEAAPVAEAQPDATMEEEPAAALEGEGEAEEEGGGDDAAEAEAEAGPSTSEPAAAVGSKRKAHTLGYKTFSGGKDCADYFKWLLSSAPMDQDLNEVRGAAGAAAGTARPGGARGDRGGAVPRKDTTTVVRMHGDVACGSASPHTLPLPLHAHVQYEYRALLDLLQQGHPTAAAKVRGNGLSGWLAGLALGCRQKASTRARAASSSSPFLDHGGCTHLRLPAPAVTAPPPASALPLPLRTPLLLPPPPQLGCGLRAFQVRRFQDTESRAFHAVRKDGGAEDFSYLKCVSALFPGAEGGRGAAAACGMLARGMQAFVLMLHALGVWWGGGSVPAYAPGVTARWGGVGAQVGGEGGVEAGASLGNGGDGGGGPPPRR